MPLEGTIGESKQKAGVLDTHTIEDVKFNGDRVSPPPID
jgi:hypothetical protein